MTKKTSAKPAPARTAKTGAPSAPDAKLSEAQLDQVRGALNFTKITYNTI